MLELPFVVQTLPYTCGAACFSSMFEYFRGWSPGEMHFAKELQTLELGYTPPQNIVNLAKIYGFSCAMKQGARVEDLIKAFAKRAVIFVTWWDEDAGHYSLVKHIDSTHLVLMDPWWPRETIDHRLRVTDFVPNWDLRGAKMIAVSTR